MLRYKFLLRLCVVFWMCGLVSTDAGRAAAGGIVFDGTDEIARIRASGVEPDLSQRSRERKRSVVEPTRRVLSARTQGRKAAQTREPDRDAGAGVCDHAPT